MKNQDFSQRELLFNSLCKYCAAHIEKLRFSIINSRVGGRMEINMTKKIAKEKRVEDIIEAAVIEFLERGYEGTSVEAVARRAGVSKGGFYHHFLNKEVLLMEANRKLSEPIMKLCEVACENESALQGLRDYIRGYLNYWRNRPRELSFFFLSMSKALDSEVLMEYYKEYIAASNEFYRGMFQKAVEMDEIMIEDPETHGITLMGALDGILSYLIVNPSEEVDTLAMRLESIWINQYRKDI